MATLTLCAETITRAPILRSFRRSVPAVARARPVPASARRSAAMRMEVKAEKKEPELVGGEAGGGGPVGEQVELLLLDGVLGVAPGAVDALVDGPAGDRFGQGGDDEAGVGLAGEVFGLGDDAARAGPARPGGVFELHKDADRAAVGPRLDPGGEEFRLDFADQPVVAGDADDVVHAVVLAPGHDLLADVGGIGPHQDPDSGSPAPAPVDDAGELVERARGRVGVAGPEHGAQRVRAVKDVERQQAVVAVVAVIGVTLSATVHSVVRRVDVEHDPRCRKPFRPGLDEEVGEQRLERLGLSAIL